jgi:hypothetical protein
MDKWLEKLMDGGMEDYVVGNSDVGTLGFAENK